MISAIDSSVILDVIADDPTFARDSEIGLRRGAAEGQLVICECVLAEIYPAFGDKQLLDNFLGDWQLDFVPSSRASAILAGRHFAHYLERGGKRARIVADFVIGAHAAIHADRLITRDRGYLRDYFSDLVLLEPSQAKPTVSG